MHLSCLRVRDNRRDTQFFALDLCLLREDRYMYYVFQRHVFLYVFTLSLFSRIRACPLSIVRLSAFMPFEHDTLGTLIL